MRQEVSLGGVTVNVLVGEGEWSIQSIKRLRTFISWTQGPNSRTKGYDFSV